MAIKFSRIAVGDELLDIHSHRMGNTRISRLGCWKVRVISIDTENQTAVVSWNGNRPETYTRREIERLYKTPPKKYLEQQSRSRF